MICERCSMTCDWKTVPAGMHCIACGGTMLTQTEDVLGNGMGNLVSTRRPSQIDMARHVESALDKKGVAVVEGPVGVGKSLAYLVPAVLRRGRVLITTAKKGLQHQLARDMPRILTAVGKPHLPWVLLKGKGNYACLVAAEKYDIQRRDAESSNFVQWVKDAGDDADKSNYPGVAPAFWPEVSAEDCIGPKCPVRKSCAYMQRRARLAEAQIVITNMHLLGIDMMLGGPGSFVLYPAAGVVIDEAHQAVEAFRSVWRKEITSRSLKRILGWMRSYDQDNDVRTPLEAAWEKMFKDARPELLRLDGQLMGESPIDLTYVVPQLERAIKLTEEELSTEKRATDSDFESPETRKLELSDAHYALRALTQLDETVRRIAEFSMGGDTEVLSGGVRKNRGRNTTEYVGLTPVNMDKVLEKRWRAFDGGIVVTSGTIAVDGTLKYTRAKLGVTDDLGKPVFEAILPSAFDLATQAVLYIPRHMPQPASGYDTDPGRAAWLRAVCDESVMLINASRGDAFVLCTSDADAKALNRVLQAELGFPVFMQGAGDDAQAVFAQFKSTPHSTVIGLKSFWEGVDVPGDKLQLVVIPKLPFPHPDDLIIKSEYAALARTMRAQGYSDRDIQQAQFNDIMMPRMIIELKQGNGRLIRTITDQGVLALLDVRVWTGSGRRLPTPNQPRCEGYGRRVYDALGYKRWYGSPQYVLPYLKSLADAAAIARAKSAPVTTNEVELDNLIALTDEDV